MTGVGARTPASAGGIQRLVPFAAPRSDKHFDVRQRDPLRRIAPPCEQAAIVTGTNSGIDEAIAIALAAGEARVVVNYPAHATSRSGAA